MKAHPPEMRERAAELRAQGWGWNRIGRELGLSGSTICRWLHPEYRARQAAKQKARRARYQGECIDCGAPTSGCGGFKDQPERCQPCRKAYERAVRVWTREAVIAAVQRFAAEHGRPPHATDWIRADPANGYPAASTVYSHQDGYTPPFASWADAIEAAGFPRPRPGGYERTEETRRRMSEAQQRRRARERASA